MNWDSISFDWNQVRAFLAAAEEGSLSAAARALGSTQPTVSRQVASLERALGVTLFERGHRASRLTDAGLELLEHVQAMATAAGQISLAASGQAQEVKGLVTISATELVASYHLPSVVARLRQVAPAVELEIVASNKLSDLGRREADIAVRHARPQHGDLVARRIGRTTAHVAAAPEYLDRVGRPQDLEDLEHLDFVGFEHPERMVEDLHARGLPIAREQVKVHTSSSHVLLALVEEGVGASVLSRTILDQRGTLEIVLPTLAAIEVPIWLVTHRELRTSRRIRVVWDVLADELARS